MDSLTQIVLGAAVGEVALGKKIGNKAMLWGAVAGTIPDLDVYQSFFFDSLRANELHRGFSHSILFSLVFAPILAWLVGAKEKISLVVLTTLILGFPMIKANSIWIQLAVGIVYAIILFFLLRNKYGTNTASSRDWTKLFFWALITHPLLDCHTTWGTQLLWPLPYKLAWNNIFVLDPLYTVPFMILLIAAMFYHRTSTRRRYLNWAGIAISSLYMLWTLGAKWYVYTVMTDSLTHQSIPYTRITTAPTPLNSILWMGTAEVDSGYYVGLYSLLDKDKNIAFDKIYHNHHLVDHLQEEDVIKRLNWLSKGWYVIGRDSEKLSYYDARFGPLYGDSEVPKYVFGYSLQEEGGVLKAKQQPRPTKKLKKAFLVLLERVKGK